MTIQQYHNTTTQQYGNTIQLNNMTIKKYHNATMGSTKYTLCGTVLFKLNTFLVMFLQVPSIDSTSFPHT
jgi:hypothetical protein